MVNNFLFDSKFSDKINEKNNGRFKSFGLLERNMKTRLVLMAATIFAFYFLTSFVSAQWWRSGVGMHVGGTGSSTQKCGNIDASCGDWPNCVDLTNVTYCVSNKVVTAYCSLNKVRNRTTSNPCTEFGLNFTDDDSNESDVGFSLYSTGTTNVLTSGSIFGSGIIRHSSVLSKADFEFRYDDGRLGVLIKGLNITKLAASPRVIVDMKDVDPDLDSILPIRAYHVELPAQFSFSSILLKMKYDADEIDNATMLVVYRCGSFNANTNSCSGSWTKMPGVSIDTANRIVSVTLTNFSVYMLGEQEQNTTTTTTTTTISSNTTTTTTTSTVPTTTTVYSSGGAGATTTSTEEETTTVPTTVEEESEEDTNPAVNATQQPQSFIGFTSLVEQNKLLIASPFVAIAGAYALYYSFQKSGQLYPKHHGKSKVYKKLEPRKLKAKNSKKRFDHGDTILKL